MVRLGMSPCSVSRSSALITGAGTPAGDALIGAGRIEKAVADHPLSARERIADDGVDMILPRNREEQRLGERPEVT